MKNEKNIINTELRRNLNTIIEKGSDFRKGGVSGNSIEYKEGNSFSSLIYYDNEEGRDSDLKTILDLI
jgi:hypothetical protein